VEFVTRSEHFNFYARRSGDKLLKVDPGKNERLLEKISRQLGVTVPGRIDYFRHEYPEQVAHASGQPDAYYSGTANPLTGVIHSIHKSHAHEIVHIVSYRLGYPGPLFVEGLAVALGDRGKIGGQKVDSLARRYRRGHVTLEQADAGFASANPYVSYVFAGSFVRHLIREHGIDRVAAFFRQVGNNPTTRAPAFAQTFGTPLSTAWDDWQAKS
jgi:hypothetical protein